MTNEELVEKLRFCAAGKCTERECGAENCWDNLMYEAADAIEELEFACNRYEKDYKALCAYLPKWIPVSEEIPKEFHNVLCYTDAYDMFIATYYGLDGDGEPIFDDNNGDYWEGNVIYWMPLPEPPKEVGE